MSPFDELTKGVSGKPFWLTGKLWLALISFLKRDRIIVGMGGSLVETPTPTGRVISIGVGDVRERFDTFQSGEFKQYDIPATLVTPTE